MSASAAYRKQVDMVNASNEERYAAYIKKVSHARKAEMHKREMRLVEVDKQGGRICHRWVEPRLIERIPQIVMSRDIAAAAAFGIGPHRMPQTPL